MTMDEDDIIKAGMEVVLKPIVSIAEDALGAAGGDWLREVRARNRERLRTRTSEILAARNVKRLKSPPPALLIPLLTEAQNEGREELLNIWASLLAAAVDPERLRVFRRRFIDIARELDPLDALTLPLVNAALETFEDECGKYRQPLYRPPNYAPGPRAPERIIGDTCKRDAEEVRVSMENLIRLGLVVERTQATAHTNSRKGLTALGREFVALVTS